MIKKVSTWIIKDSYYLVKYNWLIFFSLPEVYFSVQFDQTGCEIKTINAGKKSSLISCIYYQGRIQDFF